MKQRFSMWRNFLSNNFNEINHKLVDSRIKPPVAENSNHSEKMHGKFC